MIEVRTLEQLAEAIRKLHFNYQEGMGTLELIRSLGIDPLTQLRGADWRATNFGGCNLRGADLSDCRLAFCDFTEADVAGAVFYRSDLHRSTLHRALNLTAAYLSNEQREYLDELRAYDARGETSEGRVFLINQRIRVAENFQEAKAHFEAITIGGLQPDPYSAALLIGTAQSPEDAWNAYRMIEAAKCPVNDVVFIVLASKMASVPEVRDVLSKMRVAGYAPGVRIFTTLLSRTTGLAEAENVLEEMEAQHVRPSNVTYEILMRRTGFEGRKKFLKRLIAEGLYPGTTELNILMRSAATEEEADDAIEIANEFEIGRDSLTYALLAPYKARPNAFDALVNDMMEDDVRRDTRFYSLALNRSRTFKAACFLYGRMKADKIEPKPRIYSRLCELAGISPSYLDPEKVGNIGAEIASVILSEGTPADIVAAGLM